MLIRVKKLKRIGYEIAVATLVVTALFITKGKGEEVCLPLSAIEERVGAPPTLVVEGDKLKVFLENYKLIYKEDPAFIPDRIIVFGRITSNDPATILLVLSMQGDCVRRATLSHLGQFLHVYYGDRS